MPEPRPYPFQDLPQFPRRSAQELNRWLSRLPRWDVSAIVAGLEKSLNISGIQISPCPLERYDGSRAQAWLVQPSLALLLAPTHGQLSHSIAVEIPTPLAQHAIALALSLEKASTPVFAPLTEIEKGVLACLAAQSLSQVRASPWQLLSVIDSTPLLLEALGTQGVLWPIHLKIGAHEGLLRVWLPQASLSCMNSHTETMPTTLAQELCLTFHLSAGTIRLSLQDWNSLHVGDVLVADEFTLQTSSPDWCGAVQMHIPGLRGTQWMCRLEPLGLRYLGCQKREEPPVKDAQTLVDTESLSQTLTTLAHAPLELSIELARVRMTVAEVSSLRAGQIVLTQSPVGEKIRLCAGEETLAVGELVDVDGQIGVRILKLTPSSE